MNGPLAVAAPRTNSTARGFCSLPVRRRIRSRTAQRSRSLNARRLRMDVIRTELHPSTRAPRWQPAESADCGTVVVYDSRLGTPMYAHEKAAMVHVASAIARLKQYDLAYSYDEALHHSGKVFVV